MCKPWQATHHPHKASNTNWGGPPVIVVDSCWNVMAHGDERERKWRGNWRMQWVASTLHTTSEHGVSSITTADAHTLTASSRLNWRPRRFKWTRPFRRKTKSGFCACAITFQLASNDKTHNSDWTGRGRPIAREIQTTHPRAKLILPYERVKFIPDYQRWRSA